MQLTKAYVAETSCNQLIDMVELKPPTGSAHVCLK